MSRHKYKGLGDPYRLESKQAPLSTENEGERSKGRMGSGQTGSNQDCPGEAQNCNAMPDPPPLNHQATVAVPLTPSAVKWLAVLSRAPGGL